MYLRLPSVRNRILVFALLVTLLPSIGLGWVYFRQAEKALLESTHREMLGTVGQVRRELDLWFKERSYDIRVFSNSYLLTEGLQNYSAGSSNESEKSPSDDRKKLEKIQSYLSLVSSKFNDYSRLLIFDRDAMLLTQSPQREGPVQLPDDWQDQMETKKVILGEVYTSESKKPLILAAVPILSGNGAILGILGADIELESLADIMTSFLGDMDLQTGSAELLLVDADGRIVLSTRSHQAVTHPGIISAEAPLRHELSEYVNIQGVPVVSVLAPTSELAWNIVMEKERDQVLSEVISLRTRTLLGVGVLVTLIGFLAYLLSHGIIKPLERLAEAAAKVADGDLEVNVPVERQDELGKATQVFNDMVNQLRQSRRRLEQLSTTDSLTQLANRRHILERLATHLERFRRNGTPFSILLVDADHFKRINDSAGHAMGDKVLSELGAIFKRMLRDVDSAGRYGGEEFLVILYETRAKEAFQTAERIRLAVESNAVTAEETTVRFTVSIGVAEIADGEGEDQLIIRADNALYQAKREGRSRSVIARSSNSKVAQHPAARRRDPLRE